MKLFEHPDFDQAVIRAAEHFRSRGLREAIIEKDYYVTEALRIIDHESGSKVIFKGGTSLSKGWNLIQRFSEDVDIFLDPSAYDPELGKNAIDRELKKLRDAIGRHPALTFVTKESQTIGGFGRNDRFEYRQRFARPLALTGHQPGLQALNALGQPCGPERATAGVWHLACDLGSQPVGNLLDVFRHISARSVGLFIGLLVGVVGFLRHDGVDVARAVKDADDFDGVTGRPVENQVFLEAFDPPDP